MECKTDALNPESFECEDDYPKCVDRLTISAHNSIMPSKSLSPADLQYYKPIWNSLDYLG